MDTNTDLPRPDPYAGLDLNDPVDRREAEIIHKLELLNQASPSFPFELGTEPRLAAADLVDYFVENYPPTVYVAGRFWRCPTDACWEPLPDRELAAELLEVLYVNHNSILGRDPRGLATLTHMLRVCLDIIPDGLWDNPAGCLPLRRGLLDPHTGAFTPYRRSHYITTTLPYDYDPHAQAPAWQRFLASTVPAAADFLQEFAGYCLTADVRHELSLWLYGPPASGKSTLLHGLQTLLGPRAAELSLDDLGRRRLAPAILAGKTLLVSHEPPADPALLRPLSALVSGEAFSLAQPHGLPVTLRVRAKVALAFNVLPSLDARFASVYRRAALVVFPPLPPGAHDPHLKDRIAQEGPGLLNWALAGLRRLQQRGRFDPPSTMLAAAERLRLTHLAPAAFVEECCQLLPDARTQAQLLHRAYAAWCKSHGLEALSPRALAAEWKRLDFERVRIHGVSHWCGLALAASAIPTAESPLAASPSLSLPPAPAAPTEPAALPQP